MDYALTYHKVHFFVYLMSPKAKSPDFAFGATARSASVNFWRTGLILVVQLVIQVLIL